MYDPRWISRPSFLMYHHLVGTCMRSGRSPSYVHAVRKIADTRQDSADRVLTNVLSGKINVFMMLSRAVWARQRSQLYVPIIKQITVTRQETPDVPAIKTSLSSDLLRSLHKIFAGSYTAYASSSKISRTVRSTSINGRASISSNRLGPHDRKQCVI